MMGKRFIVLFLFITCILNAQVGINTTNPEGALEISSNDGGFLIPRMTSNEIAAIVSPENGMLIFNTDANTLVHYRKDNNTWYENTPFTETEITDTTPFNYSLKFSANQNYYTILDQGQSVLHTKNGIKPWTISFVFKPDNSVIGSNKSTYVWGINKEGLDNITNARGVYFEIVNEQMVLTYGFKTGNNIKWTSSTNFIESGKWYAITIVFSPYESDGVTFKNKPFNVYSTNIYDITDGNINYEGIAEITNDSQWINGESLDAIITSPQNENGLNVNNVSANELISDGQLELGRVQNNTSTSEFNYYKGLINSFCMTSQALTDLNSVFNFTVNPLKWLEQSKQYAKTRTATITLENFTFTTNGTPENSDMNNTCNETIIWLMGDLNNNNNNNNNNGTPAFPIINQVNNKINYYGSLNASSNSLTIQSN